MCCLYCVLILVIVKRQTSAGSWNLLLRVTVWKSLFISLSMLWQSASARLNLVFCLFFCFNKILQLQHCAVQKAMANCWMYCLVNYIRTNKWCFISKVLITDHEALLSSQNHCGIANPFSHRASSILQMLMCMFLYLHTHTCVSSYECFSGWTLTEVRGS